MHPILEKLNAYLASATEEQLKADWEELKQYNVSGPEMLDVLNEASKRLENEQMNYWVVQQVAYHIEDADCSFGMNVELNLAA